MMRWIRNNPDRIARWLVFGVVMFLFALNRSFIMDEANLAMNIMEGTYGDFFSNLKYEQFAPPLFLVVVKFLKETLGEWDWVFRIPSVISAVGVIWILSKFLDDLEVDRTWIAVIIFMCGTSFLFLRYATEFKQYMVDAFVALYWLYWSNKRQFTLSNNGQLWWFAVGGALSIWASMPVVFVLFGVGIVFLKEARNESDYRVLLPIGFWLINFLLYYLLILRFDVGREGLLDTHESFFVDLNFLDQDGLRKNWNILINTLSSFFDPTVISLVLSLLLLFVASFNLFRYQRDLSVAISLALFSLIIASGLGLYSFIPRLLIFLVPVFWLIIGFSVKGWPLHLIWIFMLWWGIMTNNNHLVDHFSKGAEFEDVKTMLDYLSNKGQSDIDLVVEAEGVPAYRFYTRTMYRNLDVDQVILGRRDMELLDQFRESQLDDTEWALLFAHTFPAEKVQRISNDFMDTYTVVHHIQAPGASLIHFRK